MSKKSRAQKHKSRLSIQNIGILAPNPEGLFKLDSHKQSEFSSPKQLNKGRSRKNILH